MRQVYRPQIDVIEPLDLNQLLHEALALAQKELAWQRISLQTDLAKDLPTITAVAGQLHLVFLSLLLNISDAISYAGGGNLWLKTCATDETIQVDFATDVMLKSTTYLMNSLDPNPAAKEADLGFGLFYQLIQKKIAN